MRSHYGEEYFYTERDNIQDTQTGWGPDKLELDWLRAIHTVSLAINVKLS